MELFPIFVVKTSILSNMELIYYIEGGRILRKREAYKIFLFLLYLIILPFYFCGNIFPAPVRGVAGDLWADVVLGQYDFAAMNSFYVDNMRLNRPGGVFVDRVSNPQRLYVYDSGNNRILCFSNINNFTPNLNAAQGFGADIVLGQADFNHAYANGDCQLQNFPGFPFGAYLSSTDPLPNPTASSLCLWTREWSRRENQARTPRWQWITRETFMCLIIITTVSCDIMHRPTPTKQPHTSGASLTSQVTGQTREGRLQTVHYLL